MKKTIKIYELLGLIKDGKAPKKIKYQNYFWEWTGDDYKTYKEEKECFLITGQEYTWVTEFLNEEVEIIEEKDNFTGMKMYQDGKEVMSIDYSNQDEEEFDDIEPLILRTFERTGQAVTTYRLEDYCDYNFEMIENTIAKIVLNQKKIIEKLKDDKNE